tara:strand:- start:262 stop:594 length:333 start_codon:yes stop_codon:yes gene_type:complete
MPQTTDQTSWVIILTLQTSTPGQPIGSSCSGIPFTAELHQSQQGEIELPSEGHGRRNNSPETAIRAWLRKHQHRNSPGGEGFHPAALPAFINSDVSAELEQSQRAGRAAF